jgi:hypothetical protein
MHDLGVFSGPSKVEYQVGVPTKFGTFEEGIEIVLEGWNSLSSRLRGMTTN